MLATSIDLVQGCGYRRFSPRMMPLMGVLAGVIWHYWLAVPLVAVGVVSLVLSVVGYLTKVSSTRYPRR